MRITKATIRTEVLSDDKELQWLCDAIGVKVIDGFTAVDAGQHQLGKAVETIEKLQALHEGGFLVCEIAEEHPNTYKVANPDEIKILSGLGVEMSDGNVYFLDAENIPDLAEIGGKMG